MVEILEITKIRKREDLKNLTDVTKVFYNEEIVPCAAEALPNLNLPPNWVFKAVSIIADYEHNAVFLKTEPGFTNQELLKKRPDLFTKVYPVKESSIEDITACLIELSTKLFKVVWFSIAISAACLCNSGEIRTLKLPLYAFSGSSPLSLQLLR